MPCYRPIRGFRSESPGRNGRRGLVVSSVGAYSTRSFSVPCGQCRGCRLERSRQWAVRCMHEASLYSANSFVTLTYSPECSEFDGNLHLEHFQLFMKRLRKLHKVRFFHVGEYGSQLMRPHYHSLFFGLDFPDKRFLKRLNGNSLYTSPLLSELWPYGYNTVGELTFESAAYCARYCMKKITGNRAREHYAVVDPGTGEVLQELTPEYTTMSRRPGIGAGWFDKYWTDVYRKGDFVLSRNFPAKPPRFYDRRLEAVHSDEYERVRKHREFRLSNLDLSQFTDEKLKIKEVIKAAQTRSLSRNFDY